MTYTLSNTCAKNLCKRTLLVQLIIKNVVTCFFGTQCSFWVAVSCCIELQCPVKSTAEIKINLHIVTIQQRCSQRRGTFYVLFVFFSTFSIIINVVKISNEKQFQKIVTTLFCRSVNQPVLSTKRHILLCIQNIAICEDQ